MKKILIIAIIIAIAGVGAWQLLAHSKANSDSQYSFMQIQRGNIQSTISSTGTLQAVETVNVGTQVSGTINQILVDFNDKVSKGLLIARLDTSLLSVTVRDANANLASAQAQYNQAQRNLDRNKSLYDKQLLSEIDYNQTLTNAEIARASLLVAQSALERATINLNYAEIRSPIDGIVIERSVDEGQTVAASLSTPTLFIIAKDLSRMQILAQADESDIGQIHLGQTAHFTVPAYPDRSFEGHVQQVRLEPQTVSNVVVYTVVLDAQNNEGLLLPGMTATVDFITQDVQNVLYVPTAALHFQPTEQMMAEVKKNQQARRQDLPDSLRRGRGFHQEAPQSFAANGSNPSSSSNSSNDRSRLWLLDQHGSLEMVPVRTGATNGTLTEILSGRGISEGMQVISGISQKNGKTSSQTSSNRSSGQSRPPGPPTIF